MLRVGLTGGIGSGKTTVAKIFETLAVPVYYADAAAKRLMNEDGKLKSLIIEHFGKDSYVNGSLNRAFLAETVFADPGKLALLNSLVHPATHEDAAHWMTKQQTPYAIKEAALIFESQAQHQLDYVIGVSAPEMMRIKRAMLRDGLTKQAVDERILNQMDDAEKMKRCDFIIVNDESNLLVPQVLKLHQTLIERSTIQ